MPFPGQNGGHVPRFSYLRSVLIAMGTLFRFGPYESNPRSRELYKHGAKLKVRPQPVQVLNLLLSRAGDVVTREEFRNQVWSNDTFVDFEHSLNTSIRELRAVLDDSATEPRYIETLPRLGYRFVAPVEVRRGEETERTAQFEAGAKRLTTEATANGTFFSAGRLAAMAAMILVAGLAVWPIWRWRQKPANTRLMIAVLPLENLTGDPNQEYLSDGLTEEMIAQLGRMDPQHVGVIARTSIMRYKHTKEPLSQIGHELGVQYVLEGGVRRESGRVRVNAELIQTRDQGAIWSREYDRDLNGLLDLQREIAGDIARETQLTVRNRSVANASERKPFASPASYEAYDDYLKGRFFWNKRTKEGFAWAAENFQLAIAKDPRYARAYAGLADTYGLMSTWGFGPQNELMPRARAAALKALELDESVAEAHTSLALVAENYDYDWARAEKEFRRASELDPEYATNHQWYAEFLSWQGRFDEALAESERARQLDPLSLIIASDHGAILYFAREYDRAIEQLRAVLDMDPTFDRARVLLAYVLVEKGQYAEAMQELERRPDPDDPQITWASCVYIYGRWGHKEDAERAFMNLQELIGNSPSDHARPLLFAYVGLGRSDDAIALLQKAYQDRSNAIVGAKVAPYDDSLRNDARFQALLKNVGLSQ
jgi:TolB-like protein/DNA-binding winged helix-turn-helix (wHTH) protein/Tfp pilus assembly protein PilF